MKTLISRYFIVFFSILLVFSFGMILVNLIPNDALEPQFSKSIAQIDKEDTYANYLFSSSASILDNFMDKLMIQTCHTPDLYENPIEAAFDNNGYPRYWNGYLLTLRPLLTQFSYQQIRYLNMFILLTAFCFCFSGIKSEFSSLLAFGFSISVIACFLVFISESLQYFSVFMVLFSVLLMILYIPVIRNGRNALLLLFAAGMAVNYFDMLTAPLLTLGIPLILIICYKLRDEEKLSLKDLFLSAVLLSVSWGAGYALCWAAKWTIGSIVLHKNIFTDAVQTARFRVEGSESYPLDRALMFKLNIETYFFAKGRKPLIFLALIFLVLTGLWIRSHKKNCLRSICILVFIALFPYVWYFVLANHSQLHYFYTYRIQAITLFSVFAAFDRSIDWSGLRFQPAIRS